MEELIKIDTRKDGRRAVSARALYISLGFKVEDGNFSRWIKQQLSSVDAIENCDYSRLVFKDGANNANVTDYVLDIEIAKEICMVVGVSPRTNEETRRLSKKIRRYFIECEKQLKQQLPGTYKEALKRLIEEIEEKERLEEQNKKLMHSTKLYTTTEIAKELNMKSAKSLNALLYKMHIQFKQNDTWVPYSDYADKGYTSIKQIILDNGRIAYDRRWTQAGRDFILDQVSKYQEI